MLALLAAVLAAGFVLTRRNPQDLPWTALDLGRPIGLFTLPRLVDLTEDAPRCTGLLARAGIAFTPLPPRTSGACGYADGVRLESGGARGLALAPAGLGTACPVAAALAMWEWQIVQPAALEHLGQPVTRLDHFGSYSCRRIYGRAEGAAWSEHATADAIDIAGFRLADGRRITVAADWGGDDADARFLHAVRDGACRLFATTLSPDYNRAHHDHFHLDMARRGGIGRGVCR
ncbi:MAG: extensin family protein [Sphingomonas fennica]